MTIKLSVRGAAPEEIARGLRAAFLVLNAAGVTDMQAALAEHQIEGWDVAYDMDPSRKPSEEVFRAAEAMEKARRAAIAACCQGWATPPGEADWKLDVA
ncbi:hypothetical protein QMO14_32355 [Variovorax sp. CAN2819]|uniref:hypothetical protein n=1 Tax=Variovorax sp. CAN15 TaxID=3046727 RepID=UPI0026499E6E|nr:hypothetical protein [Variovorax sp. CAN15]MDN6888272.1 hypothetical protein [Variovorax sp. CAN15]